MIFLGGGDCNPDSVFSISGLGNGNLLSRDYRDSRIRDSSVLNPGIKKMGTGLQALDYRFAIVSTSRIRKINCFDCIFGNDCCNAINRI